MGELFRIGRYNRGRDVEEEADIAGLDIRRTRRRFAFSDVERDLAHSAEVEVDVFLLASLWGALGTLSPEKAIEGPG
jgi:hypothetical protein